MIDEREKQLKDGLLLFEPKRLLGRIGNVRDVFEHRHLLKQVHFSPKTAEHLAGLISDALKAGKRFRVFDSLKVLRAVVIAGAGRSLSASTVESLFEIYKHLIIKSREEIQWCLSRILKDQTLDEDCVAWLVEHWADSVHIVNRLLRYPKPHSMIVEWARSRYDASDLSDRRSELVAILLRDEEIDTFDGEDPQILAWAIMQSASVRAKKIEQLSSLAARLPAEALVTFANRLNAPVILRQGFKTA